MDVVKLRALLHDLVKAPEFQPKPDGTTYCNLAVQRVARAFGYPHFDNLVANNIVGVMERLVDWSRVAGIGAPLLAEDGELVIAGRVDIPHGHVAVVYPTDKLLHSAKWGKEAPMVANVGKTCAIMGANFAFKDEPDYYRYRGRSA